jgi:hypothetical protein
MAAALAKCCDELRGSFASVGRGREKRQKAEHTLTARSVR